MEDIYVNGEFTKRVYPTRSTNQTGFRSSERRFHGAVILSLGLLNIFLLAGLIGLGVHYSELTAVKANLAERLQASEDKRSSLTEERDRLNVTLAEVTTELKRTEREQCSAGWRMSDGACYFLSSESGSWQEGKEDCISRGAHLVIVDSPDEQMFLSYFTKKETLAWIGLTDAVEEGTWKWIDETSLSLQYWDNQQPDNGGGHPSLGEEHCAHIITRGNSLNNWNDLSCKSKLKWICEKRI